MDAGNDVEVTTAKNTAGPWEVVSNEHGDLTRRFIWPVNDGIRIGSEEDPCADTHHCVATIEPRGDVAVLDANARLIAAAPKLKNRLIELLDMLDGGASLDTGPARELLANIDAGVS